MRPTRQNSALWLVLSLALHALLLATYGCWPETKRAETARASAATNEKFVLETQLIPSPRTAEQATSQPEPEVLAGGGKTVPVKSPAAPVEFKPPTESPQQETAPEPEPELPEPVPDASAHEEALNQSEQEAPLAAPTSTPPQRLEPDPPEPETKRAPSIPRAPEQAGIPSEPAAAEATAPGTIEGKSAELIRGPLPPYPRSARHAGIEGVTTLLQVDIDERGRPTKVRIIRSSGDGALDRAARNTVRRKWRFKAARDHNQTPVASREQIAIEWRLD